MNFISNFFNNQNNNNNNNINNLKDNNNSLSECKELPNHIIIKILNLMINNNDNNNNSIDVQKYDGSYNLVPFLKLSLVSKNWLKFIIPNINYPTIRIKNSSDIDLLNKWITKGISTSSYNNNSYPIINFNEIEIDFPNRYESLSLINKEFKQLLKFKDDHIFEKLKLSTAIRQLSNDTRNPIILIDFIIKYKVKQLELYNIPALRGDIVLFNVTNNLSTPILKYSLFQSVADTCSIQHLILKNQLLSCEMVLDLMDLFPKLQTLDITNNRIGIDYNQCFTFAISKAINLKTFKIGSNVLKNNIKSILETLNENCNKLTELDISENYIQDDESINSISNFIETNKTIENLNLSNNSFNELGINKIIGSLSNNCSSHLISLGLSNLESFNSSLLSDYLLSNQCNKLKYLNISNSKLIPGELGQIFKSLIDSKFQSLISFDISYCKINDQDELQLLSTLLSNTKTIEKIKLLNVFKTSIPCKQLLSNLSNSVTDLDLSLNYLNDTDCIDLSEILSSNKSIKNLNLTRNKIANIQPILDCLKLNTTLSDLNLSGNSITFINVSFEFLLSNSTLTNLNLSHNFISENEMNLFFSHLVLNESITHLNLSNIGGNYGNYFSRGNSLLNKIKGPCFKNRNTKLVNVIVSNSISYLLDNCLSVSYIDREDTGSYKFKISNIDDEIKYLKSIKSKDNMYMAK